MKRQISFKPSRCPEQTHVADMLSNPTARPTSISPLRIWFEMAETAIRPEEQKLLQERRHRQIWLAERL